MKKIIKIFLIGIFFFLPVDVIAVNLSVPFTSQAPENKWIQPWEDACEEASTIMVHYFYEGKTDIKIDTKEAKDGIKHIVNLERKFFGFDKDTNASQITEIINNFFPWEAYLIENPTIEQIKQQIDEKKPVIIPVYGKTLKNPHFRNKGPIYHVLIISGYNDEKQEFITKEPGTSFGLDYRYSYDTIKNAIHDFLPNGQTKNGRKVAIFTKKEIIDSANFDADQDGLSKTDEIKNATKLWLKDTDNDGFDDLTEIKYKFSPLFNESKISDGALIKTKNDPQVYLLKNNQKKYITNEKIFFNHNWKWNQIIEVGESFIQSLKDGEEIVN